MGKKVILFLLFVIASVGVAASPMPPAYGVNAEGICAEFFMGDECMDCKPSDDWTMVDECPVGVTPVEGTVDCKPFKDKFCCTAMHSGASGDCEDVVINQELEHCAFVEDINDCNLPEGWEPAKEDPLWGKVCPDPIWEWEEDELVCDGPEPEPVVGPDNTSEEKGSVRNLAKTRGENKSSGLLNVVLTLALVTMAAFSVAFAHRKNQSKESQKRD